jgi:hypothetical protein
MTNDVLSDVDQCVAGKANGERCEDDPLPAREMCPTHYHDENATRYDATTTDAKTVIADGGSLRYNDITGFQRDILHCIYAAENDTEQDYVDSAMVLDRHRQLPMYDSENVGTNRFYPAAHRLEDRGWIEIKKKPGEAHRRQYALTTEARSVIETALEEQATIYESAEHEARGSRATIPDGGPE